MTCPPVGKVISVSYTHLDVYKRQIHTLIQSDQYNVRNEYDKAIRLLTDYLALQKDYEHDVAICAYTLSEDVYKRQVLQLSQLTLLKYMILLTVQVIRMHCGQHN